MFQNFEGCNNPRNDHSEEKCYLTHRKEPYFYLSPLKLEIVMKKQIYLYHSVLSSKGINLIKDYTELMVRKQLLNVLLSNLKCVYYATHFYYIYFVIF